ncbi:MAG TPA: large conductance mechanosensitive channel protein MscL [Vicinamibacterales bacterium]|nr:large conductance mechanosensitive channel protein MscL [Vicinamibacterales bacterium]
MAKEFRAFIERGNVLDLAIAVVIGAAFGRVISALVEGVLMPPLGLLIGRVDFSSLFVVLDRSRGIPASLAQAREAAIPVLAYGAFLNEVVQFLIVGFAVFLVVRKVNRFRPPAPVATRACPRCLTAIPLAATRCASCCADLGPA